LFLGAPQIEEPAHGIRLGGRTHLHRGNSLVERGKLVERVLGKIDVPGPGGTSSACVDDADEYAPVGAVAEFNEREASRAVLGPAMKSESAGKRFVGRCPFVICPAARIVQVLSSVPGNEDIFRLADTTERVPSIVENMQKASLSTTFPSVFRAFTGNVRALLVGMNLVGTMMSRRLRMGRVMVVVVVGRFVDRARDGDRSPSIC